MKTFFAALLAVFVGLSLPAPEAEAKRLGGGINSGMKRDAAPDAPTAPSAAKPGATAAGAAAGQAGKRSWLGPLAGIAGAIGLAALFSSLGLGEEMADFLMILLLVVGGFLLVRWFLGRNRRPAPEMQYAAAGSAAPGAQHFEPAQPFGGAAETLSPAPVQANKPELPADFDQADFIRQAKRNFIRLQAANDAGNLEDIRDFTTPEMYAEIKLQLEEREGMAQRTEVVKVEAEILGYAQEEGREILSVRFHGLIREEIDGDAEPFDEAWHLTRPLDRSRHWAIAGIQQLD